MQRNRGTFNRAKKTVLENSKVASKFCHLLINQFKAFNAYEESKKRAYLLVLFITATAIGTVLILKSLNKNILYFNSPTEIKISEDIDFNKRIRIGGMVKKNTLEITDQEIRFVVTDFKNEIKVSFKGLYPTCLQRKKG